MSLPKWLQQRLGTPTRGRGVRHVKCAFGCRRDVLAGFDEDVAASLAIVDPVPLSPLGEALARIEGRVTYRLGRHNDGSALWQRTALNITSAPASAEAIVFADHKCGHAPLPSVEVKAAPDAKGPDYDAEPPF